jgi:hypothetical protein
MYTLILILMAGVGSPHPVKVTWDVGGFVEYENCFQVGKVIAEEFLTQGFTIGEMHCVPDDLSIYDEGPPE